MIYLYIAAIVLFVLGVIDAFNKCNAQIRSLKNRIAMLEDQRRPHVVPDDEY